MITPEAQDDDQVRQDSARDSALFQQNQLNINNNNQQQQQQQPEGTNLTPHQSGTLPVLADSAGFDQNQNQQQQQQQQLLQHSQQPLYNDAPVLPVLNPPDEGLNVENNNNNNDENQNQQQQQHIPAPPPPPPKRSLNEIVEAFKSAVGVGEIGNNNNKNISSPLATRSNNNNSNNPIVAAAVTGLKSGTIAKKKRRMSSSSNNNADENDTKNNTNNNIRRSSDAAAAPIDGNTATTTTRQADADDATQNNNNSTAKNATDRRPSWDRIFSNASFGQHFQSQHNALEASGNPPPKKSLKKKKGTSQPETPERPNNNNNNNNSNDKNDDDDDKVAGPVQSEEGPTFVSKKAKQAKLNGQNQDPKIVNNNNRPAPQQVSSRPTVPAATEQTQSQSQSQQQQQQPQLTNPIANTLPVLVRSMSTLEEDASISFVAVRAWVVDRNTGESYNNALYTPPGSDAPQLIAIPAVTFPFDIRRRFSTQPEWNQVLEIPTALPLFGQQNAVLLFELLSLGNETIRGQIDYAKPADVNELVAWGFLDLFAPTGDSNEAQDQLVQLFRPSATRGIFWSAALLAMSWVVPTTQSKVQVPQCPNPASPCIPPIFHEYASSFNRNDTYPASLCVQFQHPHNNLTLMTMNQKDKKTNNKPPQLQWRTLGGGSGIAPLYPRDFDSLLDSEKLLHRIVFRTNGTTPGRWDDDNNNNGKSQRPQQQQGPGGVIISGLEGMAAGVSDSLGLSKSGGGGAGAGGGFLSDVRKQQDAAKENKKQRRHAAFLRNNRFHRESGERCLPPNTLLHRFEIAGEVTAMATHQRILAIAITSDFKSLICFYDMLLPSMPLIASVPGHLDYVHSLKFERNGKVVVSASSDKTVRVWKTDQFGFFIKSESEQAAVCRHTLPHPFHVYDLEFIGSSALATCGFDTRLYLWSLHTGLLIGTYANPHDAFFRNLAAGGVIADSKLFALDSDYVLSTWRPMEDERTHNVSSLVLRLRVRVPGALALVVKNSIVVLQCLDNPEELNNHNNNNNQINQTTTTKGAISGNNGYVGDIWNSPMSLVVVDASLLTLVYKISLNSIMMTNPSSSSPIMFASRQNNNNNNANADKNNSSGGSVLKGLGPKSSAFFSTRSGRSRSFILPDGRLIAFADQASRIMFFDSVTGELFSSNSGVAVPGASDVPLSCLTWSQQLNLCVSASALAHTDQGRVSEIVVAARPRVDGEAVSDDTRIDFLRNLFGSGGGGGGGQPQQPGLIRGTDIAAAASFRRQNSAFAAMLANPTTTTTRTPAGSGTFSLEPNIDLSNEPSMKMHQIVSHWKEVVVKRQANQATLQQQRSNTSFTQQQQHDHETAKKAGGALDFLAIANKAIAENKNNNNNNNNNDQENVPKTKKRRSSLTTSTKNVAADNGANGNDDDRTNKNGGAAHDFDEL